MRLIGPAFALVTTVRAACDAALWQPKSGDIVQDTADALHVNIETFKDWNPELKNVNNIQTDQTFTVSYTSALDGAVWVTEGCTRFLHLGETPTAGHETSVASRTSPSGASPTATETTFMTSLARSASPRSIRSSPRQSEDLSLPSSTAATNVHTPSTSTSTSASASASASSTSTSTSFTPTSIPATTTSSEDRPTKDASSDPNLVCGGSRDGPPLICNPENNGLFFTNPDVLEKLVNKACEKYGGTFLSPNDVIGDSMDDPDKSVTQYEFMAYVVDSGE